MRRFWLFALAWLALSALVPALAQVGLPWPGPGTPHGGGGGGGSFAYKNNSGQNVSFSGTTVSTTLTSNTTAGDFIVGAIALNPTSLTVSSIKIGATSCSVGNLATTGTAYNGAAYVCWNLAGGSTTVTLTTVGTCGGCELYAEEWSGAKTASTPIDGSAATSTFAPSTGASICAGSFSTAVNGDLIWVGYYQPQDVPTSAGSGFTLNAQINTPGGSPWGSEYQTQTSAGAINGCFTAGSGTLENALSAIGIQHP